MRPTERCNVCGSRMFYKAQGKFFCAKHEPEVGTGAQYYITKSTKEQDMNYSHLATAINRAYGTRLSADEVRDIAEKAMAEAVSETQDEVWSELSRKASGSGSSLLAPHLSKALVANMTGPPSAYKSAPSTLPASDRDMHGRRRRRGLLNKGDEE